MRRFVTPDVFFAVTLLLLAVPAAGGTRPAARTATPVTLRTLVVEKGPIRALAQDRNAIAWIDPGYRVHVQRLSKRGRWVVGWAAPTGRRAPDAPRPSLALAGTRALWSTYSGGNNVEVPILTGAPGDRPVGGHRATMIDVLSFSPGGEGDYFADLAGDGTMLVYGYATLGTGNYPTDCSQLPISGGGIAPVSGRSAPRPRRLLPNVPPPALLAVSQGYVAVVPAALPRPCDPPTVAQNGPVAVYNAAGTLFARIVPAGTVKAVSLSWPQLAVLVRRYNGTKVIERYDARTGALLTTTAVSSKVSEISIGPRGIAYSAGRSIYLLSATEPRLIWRSIGAPIGVSIKGSRIAWAVNVKGQGRVVALTIRSVRSRVR
jgi:hypothetical protein